MMTETLEHLQVKLGASPIRRAGSVPTSEEINQASKVLGVPFAADYREFLLEFGGAMVGPYPIFGLRPVEVMGDDHWSVIGVTRHYRNEAVPGTAEWVVFSEDHAENPIGMEANGVVWIHDHDFGSVVMLAPNFEEYLRTRCLNMDTGLSST